MIRINLLPFRAARKKENVRRQMSVFLLSVVLVLILATWANYLFSRRINALNEQIKTTQAQVDKYNKINKEIADIKNKLALLEKKTEVIASLDLNRKAPVKLLDDMSRLAVEKRMWFTALEEKAGNIKLVGIAIDNPTVAEFMTRIEASQKYVDVKLLSISQDTSIEGLNLKAFDIRFRKTPAEKQTKQVLRK